MVTELRLPMSHKASLGSSRSPTSGFTPLTVTGLAITRPPRRLDSSHLSDLSSKFLWSAVSSLAVTSHRMQLSS
eukprot:9478919-Pyramimonas_sp.AAC.1